MFGAADDPAVAKFASEWAEEQVTTGGQARAFAQIMREHAVEGSGGLTYAQMRVFVSADDPESSAGTSDEAAVLKDEEGNPVPDAARNTWVTATALSTALNMSYVAEQLARCSGSSWASPCCSRGSGSSSSRSVARSATRPQGCRSSGGARPPRRRRPERGDSARNGGQPSGRPRLPGNDDRMNALAVFLAALATAAATGLGALPFVLVRRPERRWLGLANALASGFMIGASVGLAYEGVAYGPERVALGAVAGAAFIALTHRLLGHDRGMHFGALQGADALRALLIVGVMTLHSFTEGVGVGVAFGGGEALGLFIAIAIAVHNVPEGLAISLVLVPRGATVRRAAAWSVFSSLPQPLMAVPAYLFVETFEPFLPAGLGFAAGAMAWLVARELLPEALRESRPGTVAATVVASAALMVAFQLLVL